VRVCKKGGRMREALALDIAKPAFECSSKLCQILHRILSGVLGLLIRARERFGLIVERWLFFKKVGMPEGGGFLCSVRNTDSSVDSLNLPHHTFRNSVFLRTKERFLDRLSPRWLF
jgi:hypothetical protein